jgi:hypothetical protein
MFGFSKSVSLGLLLVGLGAGLLGLPIGSNTRHAFAGLGALFRYAVGGILMLAGITLLISKVVRVSRDLNIQEGLPRGSDLESQTNPAMVVLGQLLMEPGCPEESARLEELQSLLEDTHTRQYLFRLLYQRLDRVSPRDVGNHMGDLPPPETNEGARSAFHETAILLTNPNPVLCELFQEAFAAAPHRIITTITGKYLAIDIPRLDDSEHAHSMIWRRFANELRRRH